MTTRIPSIDREMYLIVSGGQTGADRAGLDFALAQGIRHGGWCPRGRIAEDGAISSRYRLLETPSAGYLMRTERNVLDSDATVIFTLGKLGRGSKRTADFARKQGRPLLHLALGQLEDRHAAQLLEEFMNARVPWRINVAGSRESKEPGIYRRVLGVMALAFSALDSEQKADSNTPAV